MIEDLQRKLATPEREAASQLQGQLEFSRAQFRLEFDKTAYLDGLLQKEREAAGELLEALNEAEIHARHAKSCRSQWSDPCTCGYEAWWYQAMKAKAKATGEKGAE
jgi:hypothetical protein